MLVDTVWSMVACQVMQLVYMRPAYLSTPRRRRSQSREVKWKSSLWSFWKLLKKTFHLGLGQYKINVIRRFRWHSPYQKKNYQPPLSMVSTFYTKRLIRRQLDNRPHQVFSNANTILRPMCRKRKILSETLFYLSKSFIAIQKSNRNLQFFGFVCSFLFFLFVLLRIGFIDQFLIFGLFKFFSYWLEYIIQIFFYRTFQITWME